MKTIPLIRAECTQLGLSVKASRDNGKTWQLVQLNPYKTRQTPTVAAYKTAICPATDMEEYFAELDKKKIEYRRIR